jgi:monoamine oxidase
VAVGWGAGDSARKLLAMEYDDALAAGLETLRKVAGKPGLTPVRRIVHNWAGDPYARGAYSFVPRGSTASVYDALAAPTADKLFWAGEATYGKDPATVHGAYESGLRAAAEVKQALHLS